MKHILVLFGLCAVLLLGSGCSSICVIYRLEDEHCPLVTMEDGERQIGNFGTINTSFSLFGCIPICSGKPWTEGDYAHRNDDGVCFFQDKCTLDNNILTLKSALREFKSNRICNLHNQVRTSSLWSLGLLQHKVVRTHCIVLEPKGEMQKDCLIATPPEQEQTK